MVLLRILMCSLLCIPLAANAELPAELQGLGLVEHPVASRDLPGWQPPRKVVVGNVADRFSASALEEKFPGVEFAVVSNTADAIGSVRNADALIGFCTPSIFDAAEQLQWVQVYWAGVENCVSLQAVQSGDFILTNGQRLGSPTLADHAIALMMVQTRGLAKYILAQQHGNWARDRSQGPPAIGEVAGKTMLVVGLGGIGTQVAKRAHGLGMRVIATRNSRREGPDYVDYVGLSHELLELAEQADVVVNAVPLTDATRGLFDKSFFAAMKPTAIFISIGRGQSTVTADLIEALESGGIAGASLDVTDPEPLPSDHPLWSAPNVVITPHTAAYSRETIDRIAALALENLRRYVAGEPLLSVVDVAKGY